MKHRWVYRIDPTRPATNTQSFTDAYVGGHVAALMKGGRTMRLSATPEGWIVIELHHSDGHIVTWTREVS